MRLRDCILIMLCTCPSFAAALDASAIRVSFSIHDGHWVKPLDAFFVGIPSVFDIEQDIEKHNGKVFMVRIDLDDDGAREYVVQNSSTCGKGGCPYAIFDGRSKRFLGTLYGYDIWVLRDKAYGMAIIESFSPDSPYNGTLVRYRFDGEKYKDVSSGEIHRNDIESLYKMLHGAPRAKFNGDIPSMKSK